MLCSTTRHCARCTRARARTSTPSPVCASSAPRMPPVGCMHALISAPSFPTGLRLVGSSYATASPCVGTSRWVRLNGACGALETALSTATKATLAQAIRASPDSPNPYVRDAIANTVAGGSCETTSTSGVSAIGAKVDVDGACWEHSHPLSLNVYEMSQWAVNHPGNTQYAPSANPIKAFALAGGTTLLFPASHPMNRFESQASNFAILGLLRDSNCL